ncbi:MAG: hypothetical protein ACTMHT_06445 [Oceanisphaera sp.]
MYKTHRPAFSLVLYAVLPDLLRYLLLCLKADPDFRQDDSLFRQDDALFR